MPTKVIPVDGGLVTSRDPSLLAEGEMSQAANAYYKPTNPGLFRVPGEAPFNSTAETATRGARYLEFDPHGGSALADVIVNMTESAYRTVPAEGGDFSTIQSGLGGGSYTLDCVHYNNQHFLLNGADRNYYLYYDSTTDPSNPPVLASGLHGMKLNSVAPTVSRDAGSGTGFTLSSGAKIYYWVEERVKVGSNIIKRNAASSTTVATLTGDGTLDKPVITRPDVVNSEATHWALYGTATNTLFPTGAEISEVVIGTTTIEDTRTGTDPVIPSGTIYETWGASLQGTSTLTPRNGIPPIATTGDIFEDSLVLNDVSDKTKIWYSWQDEPHKFPLFNYIRFETKEADEVTLIRSMGQHIVVCLRDSAWRVDFLPRPADSEFDIGRVKTQIEDALGCVGPQAGALFNAGNGIQLAYISRYGLVFTDGYTWDIVTDDLDWNETVNITKLPQAILINNPKMYRLEMYYASHGSNVNDKALYFHYHPFHNKSDNSFRAKVSGPIDIPSECAFVANIGDQHRVLVGQSGTLYLQGGGVEWRDGQSPAFSIRTGDLYLAGQGQEYKLNRLWIHHPQSLPEGRQAIGTHTSFNEGEDPEEKRWYFPLDRREPSQADWSGSSHAFQFGCESMEDDQGEMGVNHFIADVKFQGDAS